MHNAGRRKGRQPGRLGKSKSECFSCVQGHCHCICSSCDREVEKELKHEQEFEQERATCRALIDYLQGMTVPCPLPSVRKFPRLCVCVYVCVCIHMHISVCIQSCMCECEREREREKETE